MTRGETCPEQAFRRLSQVYMQDNILGPVGRTWSYPLQQPKTSLIVVFIAWKLLLLLVAVSSPGPGYDTSTDLLYPPIGPLLAKFVRWDAIYFTQIARQYYVFEQEWAFGWGFTRVLAMLSKGMIAIGIADSGNIEAFAGIAVSHTSHLLSVMTLYSLTKEVFGLTPTNSLFAFISALLHIFSPAGLFLSAPYTESFFSWLQFLGYYYYVKGCKSATDGPMLRQNMHVVLAGLLFGLATMVRSNGILSGILFAYEATIYGVRLLRAQKKLEAMQKLAAAIMGGMFVLFAATVPQYLAYQEYCISREKDQIRPWCNNIIPSIYAWVQFHYWNVGFLRYWTVPNVPLFVLSGPMFLILGFSSLWGLVGIEASPVFDDEGSAVSNQPPMDAKRAIQKHNTKLPSIIRRLSIPQITLAILALTNYHVQIITRLSSGYPIWYWWVASSMVAKSPKHATRGIITRDMIISRWMIIYALVQGGLFASFLPPA